MSPSRPQFIVQCLGPACSRVSHFVVIGPSLPSAIRLRDTARQIEGGLGSRSRCPFHLGGRCRNYAARRSGPASATLLHETAHWRQASAHLCIVSPWYLPHSAAQAVHSPADTSQMRCAKGELPASRTMHVRQTSKHSPQSLMHSVIVSGSIVRPSSRHSAHQRIHCKQSSIHCSTTGFEIAIAPSCEFLAHAPSDRSQSKLCSE